MPLIDPKHKKSLSYSPDIKQDKQILTQQNFYKTRYSSKDDLEW